MDNAKTKFRWLFEIPGFTTFQILNFERPKYYKMDATTEDWCIHPLHVEMIDISNPSTSHAVIEWMNTSDPRDGVLKMLDWAGNILEEWTFLGLQLIEVDLGDLKHGSSECCTIKLCVKPAQAILKPLKEQCSL